MMKPAPLSIVLLALVLTVLVTIPAAASALSYLLQATLTSATGAASDLMGFSVAVSADGTTMVVGAPGANGSRGAAYVFVRTGNAWTTTGTPTAALSRATAAPYDDVGYAVAISADGSTVVAGAKGVNSGAGAAYVFVRPVDGWVSSSTPTAALSRATGAPQDAVGYSVAISADGSTVIAGAPQVNDYAGAAYVFVKPASGWADTSAPTAALTNAGGAPPENLGNSLAVSTDGATVVVGAPGANAARGAGYVFVKPSAGWAATGTPDAMLTRAGGVASAQLAYAVAISADGTLVTAGARGVLGSQGAVYVFAKPGAGWTTTSAPSAALTNASGAAGDRLGWAVSISADGTTIVAGANGVGTGVGAAYVFVEPGSGWADTSTPAATLTGAGGAAGDFFGDSAAVSSDGSTVVSGAPGANGGKGLADVFVSPKSSNADLQNLTLSSGALSPVFAPGTTSYTANVDINTAGITVTPTAADIHAAITVNGMPVASGSASAVIALAPGANQVTVEVVAQDGMTLKTFILTVTRGKFMLDLPMLLK